MDDATHTARCLKAGCGHPAVYELINDVTVLGWCKLCRAAACDDGGFDDLE